MVDFNAAATSVLLRGRVAASNVGENGDAFAQSVRTSGRQKKDSYKVIENMAIRRKEQSPMRSEQDSSTESSGGEISPEPENDGRLRRPYGVPDLQDEVDAQIRREMKDYGVFHAKQKAPAVSKATHITSLPVDNDEEPPIRVVNEDEKFNPLVEDSFAIAGLHNPLKTEPQYDYIPGVSPNKPKMLEATIPDWYVKDLHAFAKFELGKDEEIEGPRRINMTPKQVSANIKKLELDAIREGDRTLMHEPRPKALYFVEKLKKNACGGMSGKAWLKNSA